MHLKIQKIKLHLGFIKIIIIFSIPNLKEKFKKHHIKFLTLHN